MRNFSTFLAISLSLISLEAMAVDASPRILTMQEILKRTEESKITYKINSVDKVKVPKSDWVNILWPKRERHLEAPFAEKSSDGKWNIKEFPTGVKCKEQLKEAELSYRMKNYKDALAIYLNASKEDSKCYTALLYAGDCELFSGKPKEALELYNKAIEVNPLDHRGFFFRSTALDKLGKKDEAVESLVTALSLMPNEFTLIKVARSGKFDGFYEHTEFAPEALVNREGEAIGVYSPKDKPYWTAYAMVKAIWLGEGDFRKEQTGISEHQWTDIEESQSLVFLIATYISMRKDKKVSADVQLERLKLIEESGYLKEFVLYSLGSRVSPYVMLLTDDRQRTRMREFVRKFVLVPKIKKI